MPDNPETTAPAELAAVVSALEAAEQALLAGQVDALPGLCEALTRALQDGQRRLNLPESAEQLDGATRLALAGIGQRLQTLQQLIHRQAGSVNRALGALFPAEQAHAYARLGQGPGATLAPPRVSNKTSLKA